MCGHITPPLIATRRHNGYLRCHCIMITVVKNRLTGWPGEEEAGPRRVPWQPQKRQCEIHIDRNNPEPLINKNGPNLPVNKACDKFD